MTEMCVMWLCLLFRYALAQSLKYCLFIAYAGLHLAIYSAQPMLALGNGWTVSGQSSFKSSDKTV